MDDKIIATAAPLLLLVTGFAMAAVGLPQTTKQNPQISDQAVAELQTDGERLLKILKDNDAEGFLSLCSKKGVVFWADTEAMPPDVIAKAFKIKKQVFCTLFDSTCLPQPDPANKQYSFHEMVTRAMSVEVKSFKDPESCKRCGQVVLTMKGGDGPTKEREMFLNFNFELEGTHWKLVNAEYP
jgi:hypothetical protein